MRSRIKVKGERKKVKKLKDESSKVEIRSQDHRRHSREDGNPSSSNKPISTLAKASVRRERRNQLEGMEEDNIFRIAL